MGDDRVLDAEQLDEQFAIAENWSSLAAQSEAERRIKASHEALREQLRATQTDLKVTRGQHWSLQKAVVAAEARVEVLTQALRDCDQAFSGWAYADVFDRVERMRLISRAAVLAAGGTENET